MNQNIIPTARLDPWKAAPEIFKAALALDSAVRGLGIDPKMLELIKLRASQINGCALCINIHFNDAVKTGESLQRLNLLPVWSETPYLRNPATSIRLGKSSGDGGASLDLPNADVFLVLQITRAGQHLFSESLVTPGSADAKYDVVLETSIDMVNWSPGAPGEYLGSTGQRFFRVRATVK